MVFYYWRQYNIGDYSMKVVDNFNKVLWEDDCMNEDELHIALLILSSYKHALLNLRNDSKMRLDILSKIKIEQEEDIIRLIR